MDLLEAFKGVTTFIFDVDGVLTNGQLLVLESGEMARMMNTKDGYAMQLAVKKGYKIFVVSGGQKSGVDERLRKLGVEEIFFSIKDKKKCVQELMTKYQLTKDQLLFMGDDMPDLQALDLVNLFACPKDAIPDVLDVAHYISTKDGGFGCVREVVEKVLRLNNHWGVDETIASA